MGSSDSHMQENALLQLCARPHVTAEIIDTADELVSADIDWTYLIRVGFQHQLIPLLDRTLQQVGEPQVPGDILQALSYRIEKNHQRNRYLADEWLASSESLTSAGVRTPILIQGPPLTARVYGDLSLRQAEGAKRGCDVVLVLAAWTAEDGAVAVQTGPQLSVGVALRYGYATVLFGTGDH
jgi:hypothetical protein